MEQSEDRAEFVDQHCFLVTPVTALEADYAKQAVTNARMFLLFMRDELPALRRALENGDSAAADVLERIERCLRGLPEEYATVCDVILRRTRRITGPTIKREDLQ